METMTNNSLTWEELTRREPRLTELEHRVAQMDDGDEARFCANAAWHGDGGQTPGVLADLKQLVGRRAVRQDDPVLRSTAACDLVFRRLYARLPDCRNCDCASRGGQSPMLERSLRPGVVRLYDV